MNSLHRIAVAILLVAFVGCNDKPEAKPAAAPVEAKVEKADKPSGITKKPGKKGPDDEDGPKKTRLDLGVCEAALRYGDELTVASDVPGKDPLRKIELKETAGDQPGVITITIHERDATKKQRMGEWAKAKFGAGIQPAFTQLGGVRTVFFQQPASKTDVLLSGCKDKMVQISVPTGDSSVRKQFSRLIGSLKVGNMRVGMGCTAQTFQDCVSPTIPVCGAGQWTCIEPKPLAGKPAAAGKVAAPGKPAAAAEE